jgi:4-amino-4-deoxy-L-arabinose transferase-like glycosyltransferase
LAAIRRPSQLVLVRWHLGIGAVLLVLGLFFAPRLDRHGRACLLILGIAYAVRAIIWICGGNLPLVPGDSSHGIEVATSVLRGEGPVKHYVESFFITYPRMQTGQSTLDDWAPPLDAYVRALSFRLAGLGPSASVESRFVAAKACSFVLNLLALPALYVFARRRYGCRVAVWAMAVLAVLPVHAIYAGLVLRESLMALLSILTIWMLTEVCQDDRDARSAWAWAAAGGICGGLTMLARTTGLALLAGAGMFALVTARRRRIGPLLLWAGTAAGVALPWAWVTLKVYGTPFYSETQYFEYNFSWAVHHYERGNTRASEFYTIENMPEIVRTKVKSFLVIPVYSTMIVGLPIVLGFCRRLKTRAGPGRETDLMVASIFVVFVLATLKYVADVTQVTQLGRYYLPVFALALPAGVAGIFEWLESLPRAEIDSRAGRGVLRAGVGGPDVGV